jgi:hypothetical protein
MQLSTKIKYLGLTLDKGLTWRAQLDKIMNRAFRDSWNLEALLGRHGD